MSAIWRYGDVDEMKVSEEKAAENVNVNMEEIEIYKPWVGLMCGNSKDQEPKHSWYELGLLLLRLTIIWYLTGLLLFSV